MLFTRITRRQPNDRLTNPPGASARTQRYRDLAFNPSVREAQARNGSADHSSGPRGYVKTLSPQRIWTAASRGNRQYMSVGNLTGDIGVALFFADYPNRHRLKVMAFAGIVDRGENAALIELVRDLGDRAVVKRAMVFDIDAFDWNCPQHITPRFTEYELLAAFEQKGR